MGNESKNQTQFETAIVNKFNQKIPLEADGMPEKKKSFVRKYMNCFFESLDKMENITTLCQYENKTIVSGPLFPGNYEGKETIFEYHGFDKTCNKIQENRRFPIKRGHKTGGFYVTIEILSSQCCKVRDLTNNWVKDKTHPGCVVRGAYERIRITFRKEFYTMNNEYKDTRLRSDVLNQITACWFDYPTMKKEIKESKDEVGNTIKSTITTKFIDKRYNVQYYGFTENKEISKQHNLMFDMFKQIKQTIGVNFGALQWKQASRLTKYVPEKFFRSFIRTLFVDDVDDNFNLFGCTWNMDKDLYNKDKHMCFMEFVINFWGCVNRCAGDGEEQKLGTYLYEISGWPWTRPKPSGQAGAAFAGNSTNEVRNWLCFKPYIKLGKPWWRRLFGKVHNVLIAIMNGIKKIVIAGIETVSEIIQVVVEEVVDIVETVIDEASGLFGGIFSKFKYYIIGGLVLGGGGLYLLFKTKKYTPMGVAYNQLTK